MQQKASVIRKAIGSKFVKPFYLLTALIVLSSHDLYIKMDTYFLKPNQEGVLSLYNGTFDRSENIIARDRMLDASVNSHGERKAIQPSQWKDQDSTTTKLYFDTGEAGTYVVGVSTKAKTFEQSAASFNAYLKHDGVLDMLEERFKNASMDQDAIESYEKHVKAIYQVGDIKTNDWSTVLGYPIEFVPLENPYEKFSKEKIDIKLLLDGKPLVNQLVYADFLPHAHAHTHAHPTHTHSSEDGHTHTNGQQLRTSKEGIVTVDLPEDGIYYLRTIHMINVMHDKALTHQSKWATLSFEVTHKHGEHTHVHDHDHEEDIPTWSFVLGSLVIIGILFMFFRERN